LWHNYFYLSDINTPYNQRLPVLCNQISITWSHIIGLGLSECTMASLVYEICTKVFTIFKQLLPAIVYCYMPERVLTRKVYAMFHLKLSKKSYPHTQPRDTKWFDNFIDWKKIMNFLSVQRYFTSSSAKWWMVMGKRG